MQKGELLIVYEAGQKKPLTPVLERGNALWRCFRPQWAVRNVKNR
jgi:hypothetical protein